MKNPIKKYFIFASEWPLIFSILTFFFIVVLFVIFYFFAGEEATNLAIRKYGAIFIVLFFVHMFLVYFIKHRYITIIEEDDYNYNALFFVLVTKEGKRMILTDPVWEKGEKYAVIANRNYLKIESCGADGETETKCFINGKYKNSLVSVPVILKLKYDGGLDRMDLFSLLLKNNPDSKELHLDNYLNTVFKKVNEPNQSKFDEIISRYAQLKISDAEFLSELLDVVEFPERIFHYVTDTKICLGNPVASACKGVMCEK